MQTPISQSAAASAWSSRRAYGAPDAPVMPRKTRTAAWNTTPRDADADRGNCFAASPAKQLRSLFAALGGLEEGGELLQVILAQAGEARHRAAAVHAGRALEVRDLEGDALVLRALRGEVRRAEVVAAGPVVGVAVEAAGDREEPGARDRGRIVRKALRLRAARHLREQLAAERLLRGRALVGEHAHRDDEGSRRRSRPASAAGAARTARRGTGSRSAAAGRSSGCRSSRG